MWGSSKKKAKAAAQEVVHVNTGYLYDLSPAQEECFTQFKDWIKVNEATVNPWHNDSFFLRFCRARKFDLNLVIEMFSNYMEYRKEHKIDTIMVDFEFTEKEAVMPYYPKGYMGVCKKGRPIYIERSGKIQPSKIWEFIEPERLWQSYYQSYEQLIKHHMFACSLQANKQIMQTFSILDMTGFSISMMNKRVNSLVQNAAKISQDYYPEIMGQLMIVNVPMLFTGVWAIVKGWLDEKTRQKIQIIGGGYTKKLLEYVDEDQLAKFLGGKSDHDLIEDFGPWNDYEVVDGSNPDDVVGIRKKGDPEGAIFTPGDLQKLDNPLIPFQLSEHPEGFEAWRASQMPRSEVSEVTGQDQEAEAEAEAAEDEFADAVGEPAAGEGEEAKAEDQEEEKAAE